MQESSPRWWGKHGVIADALVILSLASAAVLMTMLGSPDEESPVYRWPFTRDAQSITTLGLAATTTGAGTWRVEEDSRATGAYALVNHLGSNGAPPAIAIAVKPVERNVRVRTRCRVLELGESRACGLVFRHFDADNYYSARVDAAQQRVVLSVVKDGAERIIARAPARLDTGVWQEIVVAARGDRIDVSWNGEPSIEATDSTYLGQGAAGLWTTATAVAHFDELLVERLPRGPWQLLRSAAPL